MATVQIWRQINYLLGSGSKPLAGVAASGRPSASDRTPHSLEAALPGNCPPRRTPGTLDSAGGTGRGATAAMLALGTSIQGDHGGRAPGLG